MITLGEQQAQLAEIEKRRKGKDREGKAEREREPLTDAHAAAEAGQDQMRADAAAKAYQDCGATGSPGHGMPGQDPGPARFGRGYERAGHAAASPQSGPPCDFPVAPAAPAPSDFGRGYITPGHASESPANTMPRAQQVPPGLAVVHGSGPAALGIAAHQASAFVPAFPPQAGGQQPGGSAA